MKKKKKKIYWLGRVRRADANRWIKKYQNRIRWGPDQECIKPKIFLKDVQIIVQNEKILKNFVGLFSTMY